MPQTTADALHTPHSSHGAAGGQRSCASAEPLQRPAPIGCPSSQEEYIGYRITCPSPRPSARQGLLERDSMCRSCPHSLRALPWCLSTTSRQQPSRAAAALVLLSFVNRPASANSLGAIRTRRRVMMCGGVATGRSCSAREQEEGRRPPVALSAHSKSDVTPLWKEPKIWPTKGSPCPK